MIDGKIVLGVEDGPIIAALYTLIAANAARDAALSPQQNQNAQPADTDYAQPA